MAGSPHCKELLQLLNELDTRYLVVGGYAVMKYTEPRYTKDLALWVEPSPENSPRVFKALQSFGAPLESDGISAETFTYPEITYQIGVAPVRIDILTQITGVKFSAAWEKRVKGNLFGLAVNFISLDHLIANKQKVGRGTDLAQLKQISETTE